jgi:phosphoenolpyruvate-protein kinase (PTS system EI component)
MDARTAPEATLAGRSIAPSMAIGPAWVVSDPLHWVGPATPIGNDDVEKELIRMRHSFEETLAELDQHAQRIEGEFDAALAGIFRAHGAMLRSLLASGELERELRESLLMGFRSLSIAPHLIPTTKALIRTIRLDAATRRPRTRRKHDL